MKIINIVWLDNFCKLNQVVDKNSDTMVQMLSNITTKKCFISLYNQDQVIACDLGVKEREYIGGKK